MGMKSNTLLTVSRTAGKCGECRHANQGTVDFSEGLVFCQRGGGRRTRDSECTERIPAMATPGGALAVYFLFEPFDGSNGTWGALQDARVLAEDADVQMRSDLRADTPVIPADH